MGLGLFIILGVDTSRLLAGYTGGDLTNALAWFLFAFAVFNTYMLIASLAGEHGRLRVFLTLEITEILLVIGFFNASHNPSPTYNNFWLHAGGWAGIVTAAVAWYTSAAGVMNGVSGRVVLPVGKPFTTARARSMATA